MVIVNRLFLELIGLTPLIPIASNGGEGSYHCIVATLIS